MHSPSRALDNPIKVVTSKAEGPKDDCHPCLPVLSFTSMAHEWTLFPESMHCGSCAHHDPPSYLCGCCLSRSMGHGWRDKVHSCNRG